MKSLQLILALFALKMSLATLSTFPVWLNMFLPLIRDENIDRKTVVCYYRSWAQGKRSKARFIPENIDVTLCSVVNYASMQVNLYTHKLEGRRRNDGELLYRLNLLKEEKPSLKIFISVGGWNHEKKPRFSRMVRYRSRRRIFIKSVIAYLHTHRLDGISLDWEYPGNRGSPAKDKYRFIYLLREMLAAFQKDALKRGRKRYFLTLAVSSSRKKMAKAYNVKEIAKYVDWVNVMAYNLRGPWRKVAGCPTLTKGKPPNVPDALSAWLEAGMPPGKINLGLATYGRTYTLKNPSINQLGAPITGVGPAGIYTKKKGVLAYYEICPYKWTHMTSARDSACGIPYASEKGVWVAYEDTSSIRYKVSQYVNKQGLNGISVWALDFDDFSGKNCFQGRYPLLRAAVNEMEKEFGYETL